MPVKRTPRHISTKREIADPVDWVLSHYDDVDRLLLREAARVHSLGEVINKQWAHVWVKRGFDDYESANQQAQRKGLPNIIIVTKADVAMALEKIANS